MKKGFTLIELLVVVLIIGILAAIALPQYRVAATKARAVQVVTLVRSLKEAQDRYYLANGSYTKDFESLDVQMPAGGTLRVEGMMEYPDGTYYAMMLSSDPSVVYGYLGGDVNITWMRYLPYLNGGKELTKCYAYASGGKAAQQTCQSFGGKFESTVNGGKSIYVVE